MATPTPPNRPEDDHGGFYHPPSEPIYDEDKARLGRDDLARHEDSAAGTPYGPKSDKSASPEDIGSQEAEPQEPSFYTGKRRAEEGKHEHKGAKHRGPTRLEEKRAARELKGKHRRLGWFKSKRNKIILGALAGGGGGIAGVIASLLVLGPGLIPTLTFDIDDNRFARLGRRVTINTENIIRFRLALDSTGDQRYREAIDRFRPDTSTRTGRLFNKIDSIRPEKLVEHMALDVEFEYARVYKIPGTDIERRKVTAVIYKDGTRVVIPQNNFNFGQRIIHPYRYATTLYEGWQGRRAVLRNVSDSLNPDNGRSVRFMKWLAVRKATKIAKDAFNIRKTARWSKAQIEEADKSPPTREEAHVQATQDSFAQATDDGARPIAAAGDDEDAKRNAEQTNEAAADPELTKQIIDSGDTVAPAARADITRRFDPASLSNLAGRVIGTASSIVEVGALLCLVNDASVAASEKVINANSAMAAATFASMSAAGNQQIYSQLNTDKRVNASLTGGYNDQLNDGTVPDTNAFKEASGHPYDTSNTISPHASAAGMFGSKPLGFLPSGTQSLFDRLEDPKQFALAAGVLLAPVILANDISFCDTVGNPWSGGVIALGELAATLIPGIGQAGKVTAFTVGKAVVKGVGTIFKSQLTKRALIENAAFFGAQQLITLLGQSVAENRMGAFYNGLAQGAGYINGADAGAEVIAQRADAVSNAARPLNQEEYQQAERQDEAYRGTFVQTQSLSERYFATDNPRSLLNRAAFATYTNFNSNGFRRMASSLVQSIARIFNPASLFAAATAGATVGAQDNPQVATRDYGVVQRGWSADEETAYISNDDYSPLFNEMELDASGRADELLDKYGKCFDDETGTGTLLANNDIQRDQDGNVIDDGLCSPSNLGDNTPNNGELNFKNDEAALVFRLRVSIRNNNAVDSLIDVQEVTTDEVEDEEE